MTESRALRWDGGPDEKTAPGQFLREINIKIEDKEYNTDKKKIECFRNNLDYGGTADLWYDELPDDTKKDWDKLVEAFDKEWPKNAVPKPSKLEQVRALKDWTITAGELGTKTKTTGSKDVWTHVKWANGLAAKVRDAEDKGGLLLQDVFDALPEPIRDLIRDKPRADYKELAETVRTIDVIYLQETVDKHKRNEETARLARVGNSPTKTLRDSFASTHIHSNAGPRPYTSPQSFQPHATRAPTFDPFGGDAGGRGNLFGGRGSTIRPYRGTGLGALGMGRQTPGPPFTTSTADRPFATRHHDLRNINLPHHPDTEAGHAAYNTQVIAWNRANPNGRPDELHPFPLTPGTAPLGSRECWDCGRAGHRTGDPDCPRIPIPDQERTWRRVASRISREAAKERYLTQNVNFVGHGYHDHHYGYDNYEQPYRTYNYPNELDDGQGNGEGPSA